jgi:hypothetical protein
MLRRGLLTVFLKEHISKLYEELSQIKYFHLILISKWTYETFVYSLYSIQLCHKHSECVYVCFYWVVIDRNAEHSHQHRFQGLSCCALCHHEEGLEFVIKHDMERSKLELRLLHIDQIKATSSILHPPVLSQFWGKVVLIITLS